MKACAGCRDWIYEGEASKSRPEVHIWCAAMAVALLECNNAMARRREKGLPTPTHAMFRDPNRPQN